ncbi:MAG: ArnT family glycosyltransferase [Burkholderiaceae bacterium]
MIVGALLVLRLGLLWLHDLPLQFDEAQYYGWSLEPAWGYYSKPPMIAWSIAAATAVCGDAQACVRAPAPILTAFAAFVCGLLVMRLSGARAGLWAGVAIATMPLVAFYGGAITTDSPLLLCWAVALYTLVRASDPEGGRVNGGWWIACGIACGLGLMSKYSFGVFAVTALAWLIADPRRRGFLRTWGPWGCAAVAAVIWAPNVAWNVEHGFATLGHTAEISRAGGSVERFNLAALAEFVAAQPLLLGVPIALAAARAWMRASRDNAAVALGWHAFWPMALVIGAQALFTRAHANWAAPALIGAAIAGAAWLASPARGQAPRTRWFRVAVGCNLAVMVLLAVGPFLAPALPAAWQRLDPYARLRGWPELGREVAAVLVARPGLRVLSPDRRILSEMIYYARPHAYPVAAWNPEGTRTDHYRLLRDLAGDPDAPRRAYLFVGREGGFDPDVLRAAFETLTPVGTYDGPVGSRRPERHLLIEVRGFRGYPTR